VQQAEQLDPRNRKAEDSGRHEQPHRDQTSEAAEDRSTATHDATT
jgi:hypothetical protein